MSYRTRIFWHDVFDSNKRWYWNIDECFNVAKTTGYTYFTWCGWIYHIHEENNKFKYFRTDWKTEHIE